MRRIFYALLSLFSLPALAQVSPVIDRTDMPAVTAAAPVDSLRLSAASIVLPAGAPPLSRRGANQTWNYGSLVATSQRVERYVAVSSTAPFYQFSFGALGGVNRATVASPQALPLPAGLPLPITDPYEFYNVSAATATSQDFRSVGFGGTVSGVQLPVTYASQVQQDVIYRFPLSFASPADSCNSFFSITVPGTGYLSQKRKRVNKPDAWGTLTTPFGTFQTVRVVTKLIDRDSIAVAGAPGTGIALPVRRQYKWLAKQQHVPLLTITTTLTAGQEVVSSVEYRDIYRRIVRLGSRSAADASLGAAPNPLPADASLRLNGLPAGPLTLTATDLLGRRLWEQTSTQPGAELSLPASTFGSFHGVLLLSVHSADGVLVRRIVRE